MEIFATMVFRPFFHIFTPHMTFGNYRYSRMKGKDKDWQISFKVFLLLDIGIYLIILLCQTRMYTSPYTSSYNPLEYIHLPHGMCISIIRSYGMENLLFKIISSVTNFRFQEAAS